MLGPRKPITGRSIKWRHHKSKIDRLASTKIIVSTYLGEKK